MKTLSARHTTIAAEGGSVFPVGKTRQAIRDAAEANGWTLVNPGAFPCPRQAPTRAATGYPPPPLSSRHTSRRSHA